MANALSKFQCTVLVDAPVAQHDELVAADAGDDVGRPSCVGDAMSDLHEQRVADIMPDGVVDFFEAVDVHEQDGDVVAGAADAVERVGRGALQLQAVGKAGERVVVGLPGELQLQVLGGCDVAGHPTPVLDETIG